MNLISRSQFKKYFFNTVSLIGLQFSIFSHANAWIWYDSSFKICNKLGYSLQILNTGNYQMHTNNEHSNNQVINANSCVNIDFAALWQSNGYDFDDALDFSLKSNDKEYGKFTIFVNSYLNGLIFDIKNNSNFIHLIDTAKGGLTSHTGYIELYQ